VAACTVLLADDNLADSKSVLCRCAQIRALDIANEYNIGIQCMEMVYMLTNPYHESFDELLGLRLFDLSHHHTAGLSLIQRNGRFILANMIHSTPGAKIPRWRTQQWGAWLIKIGEQVVQPINIAQVAFKTLKDAGYTHATAPFAHPEVHPDISRRGLLIVSAAPFTQFTHNQLKDHWEFLTVAEHLRKGPMYDLV
jgi:hypothetical protein